MLDKVLFKLIGKNKKKLFLIAALQVINFLFTLRASFLFCYVIFELVNNTNLTSLYYLLLIALFVLFKFFIQVSQIQSIHYPQRVLRPSLPPPRRADGGGVRVSTPGRP